LLTALLPPDLAWFYRRRNGAGTGAKAVDKPAFFRSLPFPLRWNANQAAENMMNEQENIQLVKQAYNHFKNGDIQALLGLCADNIEWELPLIEGVPFSGKRQGKEQVAQFFQQLAEAQESLQFEPKEFIAQNDKVACLGHYAWSVRATDRNFECDWAHVFTTRNGQIAGFHEYSDTAAEVAAYQPR
jgi:ketosteroid isomerase-like protein